MPFRVEDWASIRLVVFDLDGTLYDQRPVRIGMAAALAMHSLRSRSLRDLRTLGQYRRLREAMGDEAPEGFAEPLLTAACLSTGRHRDDIRALVEEWIERRPLRLLRPARVAGAAELFDALRASGRTIGVWSDYPVTAKLAAMALGADHIRSAGDVDLGHLKPVPAGLLAIMAAAGVGADQTLMIGDRAERDGEAARRAGVRALIRSKRSIEGYTVFRRYDDTIFAPVLTA